MTEMEKFRMYQEKNAFIRKLDLVLTTPTPKGLTVEQIDYELYKKEAEATTWYQEVIVFTYKGGGTLPVSVNGNSNLANLKVIAQYAAGGDYSFKSAYETLKESWTLVDLD